MDDKVMVNKILNLINKYQLACEFNDDEQAVGIMITVISDLSDLLEGFNLDTF